MMLACTGKREADSPARDRRQLLINAEFTVDMPWTEGESVDDGDGAQLVIASCVSETVRTSDGKHTVYCMRAVMIGARGAERRSWEVRRRYSEFHDLHTRMKALGAVHSDLPSRNPLAMMGALVREKIERERERGLQDYLNAVLERCTDDQCLLLAKFLRVNKHLTTSMDACSNGSGSPAPDLDTSNHTHSRPKHNTDTYAAPVPRRHNASDAPLPHRAAPHYSGTAGTGTHTGRERGGNSEFEKYFHPTQGAAGEARGVGARGETRGGGGVIAQQQRQILENYAIRRNGSPMDGSDGVGGGGGGIGEGRSTPRAALRGDGKRCSV